MDSGSKACCPARVPSMLRANKPASIHPCNSRTGTRPQRSNTTKSSSTSSCHCASSKPGVTWRSSAVGVGKTFIAHALGHIACRRRYSVIAMTADHMLKNLRHARLDNSHEAEMRRLLSVDLLIIDDFGLDGMDANGSRDIHELMTERHRRASIVLTSNRGPDEWLVTFSDPIRAQAAIDRFTGNAYDLVIEGDTYRSRQKPKLQRTQRSRQEADG